ncbi:MAG TPA: glyoxalase [Rhodobacteraceae bacterium]|nr:glyoxalase [Paracoccaceae bacterium]
MFRLDHIQLAIPAGAERACRAFWSGCLGFDELKKPKALRPRGGAWFVRDGVEVHLGVDPAFAPAKKAHPAFAATDLDAVAAALSGAGHPVRWDDAISGRRRFFTDDPVGNRIEFLEK